MELRRASDAMPRQVGEMTWDAMTTPQAHKPRRAWAYPPFIDIIAQDHTSIVHSIHEVRHVIRRKPTDIKGVMIQKSVPEWSPISQPTNHCQSHHCPHSRYLSLSRFASSTWKASSSSFSSSHHRHPHSHSLKSSSRFPSST